MLNDLLSHHILKQHTSVRLILGQGSSPQRGG